MNGQCASEMEAVSIEIITLPLHCVWQQDEHLVGEAM
jgi:hypothetical protein